MRALVTGVSGFIGRHAARHLVKAGWQVEGVDIVHPEPDNRVTSFLKMDVRDWFRLDRPVMGDYDLVVHAAGVVGGRAKIEGVPLDLAVNLSIDAEFFQWLILAQPAHTVYISSSAVYPINLQHGAPPIKLTEDRVNLFQPGLPDLTYGWSKLTGEHLARYARSAGVNVHIIRPFSGYGEDQSLDYPFPSFMNRVWRQANPFPIWGDGSQVRDWIHVDDIIGCMLAMVDQNVPGPINCGWGRPTSFFQLCELVHRVAGLELPAVELLIDKPAGVQYRVAEVTNMHEVYYPTITLEEGIRRALGR